MEDYHEAEQAALNDPNNLAIIKSLWEACAPYNGIEIKKDDEMFSLDEWVTIRPEYRPLVTLENKVNNTKPERHYLFWVVDVATYHPGSYHHPPEVDVNEHFESTSLYRATREALVLLYANMIDGMTEHLMYECDKAPKEPV